MSADLLTARRRHNSSHGPHDMADCTAPTCQEARDLAVTDPLASHGCLEAAVVVDGDRRVWYPCRSHEGGVHHFAANWPACPAAWCRLPASHATAGTMHDIPGGTVVLVGPNEVIPGD